MAFIRSLHRFRDHVVLEKRDDGPSSDIVTIAPGKKRQALEEAKGRVRTYYDPSGCGTAEATRRRESPLEQGGAGCSGLALSLSL